MDDPISDVLKAHIAQARRQLAWLQRGVSFAALTEQKVIPVTEQDTLILISELEAALRRHEERNAKGP